MIDGAEFASVNKEDVASYLAGLLSELVTVARTGQLPTIAYLIDMARLEAETSAGVAGRPAPPRAGPQRRRPSARRGPRPGGRRGSGG